MKLFVVLGLCLAVAPGAMAQIHPPVGNARYDDSNAFVFRDGELTTIHVTMSPTDLSDMLANPWNEVEYPCTMRFQNTVTDETKQDVTIKVRGSTSRNSIKKSFRLAFNTIVSGTRFHGIKKLNIIGAQNDVSIVRTKLALDQLRVFGIPSQRAVLTHFTINDGSRVNDIYIGTEQLNDDYLKAWFGNDTGNLYKGSYQNNRADLRYVEPGDAVTYQNLGNGQTYVEENNDENPNFTDLADLIRFINQSTDEAFFEGLPLRFNVDGFLRTMAADVVLGNWDNIWFGSNNWLMYHNPTSNRFEWIPYDYDNTFGVDFFGTDWARRPLSGWGNGGFGSNPDISPLMRRVLAVPSWEAHLRRYIHQFVGPPVLPVPFVCSDSAGDTFLGAAEPHFDIRRVLLTNDADSIYITLQIAGPIDTGGTTDQARYMLFFNTVTGGRTDNPWNRDINNTVASDYFLGVWTNGGGGFLGYRAGSNSWSQIAYSGGSTQGISVDFSDKANGIVRLIMPRTLLEVSAGGAFSFDVVSTNDRGVAMEPGVDHLSNLAQATPNYDTPSTPGLFRLYTLQNPPADTSGAPFSPAVLSGKIEQLKALATPFAYRGPMSGSTMDWNWTPESFAASFDTPTNYQSPGRPWNWGIKPYISTRSAYLRGNVPVAPPLAGVYVNEVLPVNNAVNTDGTGAYDAWVELYNSKDTPVDLGGMYLSNTPLSVRKWRIPDGTTIPGKGFQLIWADNQPEQGVDHATFTLIPGGQTVGLYDRDANSNLLIDSLRVPSSTANLSYGRFPDGATAATSLMPFTTVTPLAPNSNARAYNWDDAIRALRMAGGLETATGGVGKTNLDANGDAVVDSLDTVVILRRLSGL